MQVRLNCWRDGHNPGDIVEVEDTEAAGLIHHGAAFAVDDLDAAPTAAEASTGRVVKGEAVLTAASSAEHVDP